MIKRHKLLWICLLSLFLKHPVLAIPKIIFDSDIARVDSTGRDISDIDDLAALTILNALANKKLIEIIAIVTNSRSNKVVEMIDAINTYYNNPGIPIGLKEGSSWIVEDKNSYARLISGKFKYTQRTIDAPSSTELLRKVLSEVSKNDTVIYIHADCISTYDFLSIASFLESGADAISPLTGWELLNAKVDKFVSFIPCLPNKGVSDNCPAWSNQPSTDVSKLQYFLDNYQNSLIGNTTTVQDAHFPTKLWEQSDDNPVKIAYQHYYSKTPPPWHGSNEIPDSISNYGDGLGAFYLLTSNDHLFTQIHKGSFIIDQDSKLRWSETKNRENHRYFYAEPKTRKELWVLLDELICHKPK
ncbi:MAG: hypothetical protein JJU28_13595 [Cyclobacteriaceae bacterium]|nr:hypothetical protein [Cyclobacteriaceae bacterium]